MKGNKLFKKIDRFFGIPLVFVLGLAAKLFNFFRKPEVTLATGDRVLAVKLSALGDTFILLPVFKALKEKVGPEGRVIAIVTPINEAALEGFPYVDEVLVLNFAHLAKDPKAFFTFLIRLISIRPAFALDFDQWLRVSPLLCFFSLARRRYGFKTPSQHRHFLYHRTIPNEKTRHEFEQFASIAGLAGVDRSAIEPFNGFLEREHSYGGPIDKTGSKDKWVHIHPGCGSYGWQRAWPESYYIQLIRQFSAKGFKIRLTGMGSYEESLIKGIIQKADVSVDNQMGKLSLAELSTLLREADLVVCGNTGVLHLAAGLGRPIVTMNGPANSIKWGAIGPLTGQRNGEVSQLFASVACSPCTTLGYEYGCPLRPCMESIGVEKVFEESIRLLSKRGN